MDRNERKLFVVFEEHMIERYCYLINKYNFKSHYVVGFKGIQIGTSIKDILNRIKHRSVLEKEYQKLKNFILKEDESSIGEIYFSNSEGYIAHNFLKRIKEDFPTIELIGLQHGIFELTKPPKKIIRNVINEIVVILFNFYPIGVGFGAKITDKYIVYNKIYRDFLIDTFGWDKDKVLIDFNFLKTELYDKRIEKRDGEVTALFLTQCLSKASLCSKKEEDYLNDEIIKYLLKNYKKVIIKLHPACLSETNITLYNNCEYIDNLIEAFNRSTHAFSFASTTLLEAQIFDLETFAINSKRVNDDKSIYKIFSNVIDFENEIR